MCAEVAIAMAEGALKRSPADLAVAVTGVAGRSRTRMAIPLDAPVSPLHGGDMRPLISTGTMAISAGMPCADVRLPMLFPSSSA
jgi:Competence-damaged protein